MRPTRRATRRPSCPDMPPPRIPPIHCLLSFEALARLRSVTLAADELNVTPSAVSHRMRQLESQLGVRLFARSDFTLSADGAVYLAQRAPGPAGTAAGAGQRAGAGHGQAAPGGDADLLAPDPAAAAGAVPPRLPGRRADPAGRDPAAQRQGRGGRPGDPLRHRPLRRRRAAAHPQRRGVPGVQPRLPQRGRPVRRLRQHRARWLARG